MGIHIDAQAIIHGLFPEKQRMRFACSMSRSISLRRPYKLTTEQSDPINELPRVRALQDLVQNRKHAVDLCSGKEKRHKNSIYVLSTIFLSTLEHLVACNAHSSEKQLASIVSQQLISYQQSADDNEQILDGLSHLVACSFGHQSLTYSNVLLKLCKTVQIDTQDLLTASEAMCSKLETLHEVSIESITYSI